MSALGQVPGADDLATIADLTAQAAQLRPAVVDLAERTRVAVRKVEAGLPRHVDEKMFARILEVCGLVDLQVAIFDMADMLLAGANGQPTPEPN